MKNTSARMRSLHTLKGNSAIFGFDSLVRLCHEYQRESNFDRLAAALDQLKAHAPDGYGNWAELAGNAATAARAKDEAGVRKSCKGCHDEHRAKYRRERRNAPWL